MNDIIVNKNREKAFVVFCTLQDIDPVTFRTSDNEAELYTMGYRTADFYVYDLSAKEIVISKTGIAITALMKGSIPLTLTIEDTNLEVGTHYAYEVNLIKESSDKKPTTPIKGKLSVSDVIMIYT